MSTSISLTYPIAYNPGVARSDSPGLIIFRRVLDLIHYHTFQISAEAVAVLSVFAALAVWVFALSSGKVTNPQIFLGS